MTDMLKRELAPIPALAWERIDTSAIQVIKANLTARTVVDFDGPHGWELGAINLGRLNVMPPVMDDVPWGVRQVLPLVEVRIPFTLNQMELDSVARGSLDPDLDPLEEAARKIARFEERAIYHGMEQAGIRGILGASSHQPLTLTGVGDDFPEVISKAVEQLKLAGVGGPFALVVGAPAYQRLTEVRSGYPPYRMVREILQGGAILWSPELNGGGVVLSQRGGDFELTVGQDISIGYAWHDKHTIELFLTESFQFRVLEEDAAIELKLA